jgi:phosphatidylglycerol phospholipase C
MHKVISAQENWEATLAPRIILGLWHPKFIAPAQEHLKYLTLAHIGISPWIARTYFWDSCNSFSIRFASLATFEGERFRNECRKAGKKVMVWTVNKREEMMEVSGV